MSTYSAVKKKRQDAKGVVELHFSNSMHNPSLEVPLGELVTKGPQHFLDTLYAKAMDHINFTKEQQELLTLHFIFRGRRLNYNGIKYIELMAEQTPVTIVHVELDYNYERVRAHTQLG